MIARFISAVDRMMSFLRPSAPLLRFLHTQATRSTIVRRLPAQRLGFLPGGLVALGVKMMMETAVMVHL